MRNILVSAILLIVLNIFFTKSGYSQFQKPVVGALIEYEDFATSTVENVPCDFFKEAFAGTIRRVDIKDRVDLKRLAGYANEFKMVKPKPIDVRVLLTICYSETKEEYCMDRWGLFVNKWTAKYYSNKRLADYILKRCR
ncbi:hypothetical protein [Chitinophaga sp. CB10]|uniref:hypothetical protein n=1 Tax=Chitinophaga sp. CB10 TaxID=1891659 RepID=UPI0025BD4CB8|nr:hypothetical protein [Chitinophaga sp. CB10]